MTAVSDIFAFVAANPDYWDDFLSGADSNYPDELENAEVRALEAARAHIEPLVVELLTRCGAYLVKGSDGGVKNIRFKNASTAKNRYVEMPAPKGQQARLYGVRFALESQDGVKVRLHPSVAVKAGFAKQFLESLGAAAIPHKTQHLRIFGNPIEIEAGRQLGDLAGAAVDEVLSMLKVLPAPE